MGEEVREGFLEEEIFLLKVTFLFIVPSVPAGINERVLCASLSPDGVGRGPPKGLRMPVST